MTTELTAREALMKELARPSLAVVVDWWKTANKEEKFELANLIYEEVNHIAKNKQITRSNRFSDVRV